MLSVRRSVMRTSGEMKYMYCSLFPMLGVFPLDLGSAIKQSNTAFSRSCFSTLPVKSESASSSG